MKDFLTQLFGNISGLWINTYGSCWFFHSFIVSELLSVTNKTQRNDKFKELLMSVTFWVWFRAQCLHISCFLGYRSCCSMPLFLTVLHSNILLQPILYIIVLPISSVLMFLTSFVSYHFTLSFNIKMLCSCRCLSCLLYDLCILYTATCTPKPDHHMVMSLINKYFQKLFSFCDSW